MFFYRWNMDKNEKRKEYLNIRKNVANKEEKSLIICNKILLNEKFKNSRVVALYFSAGSEVMTTELIKESIALGKTVCLPRVIGEHQMMFYKVTKDEKYYLSDYNINEPLGEIEKIVDKMNIDLMIVPGVSFSLSGARLGYGQGFYDYYLENTNIYKIGICFKEQICNNLVADKTDVFMDEIITN